MSNDARALTVLSAVPCKERLRLPAADVIPSLWLYRRYTRKVDVIEPNTVYLKGRRYRTKYGILER